MLKYFLTFLITTQAHSADKFLYLLGGGGDPKGDTTIFDSEAKRIAKFSNSSDWKTEVYFNGGHAKTEEILKENFKSSYRGDFVKNNYDKLLADLKRKLTNNEIKSGDQLMIVLSTHGGQKTDKEKTHAISFSRSSATNLVDLKGADIVSLDTINEVLKLAENKGVKLALIDQTCHSGSTLNLNLDYSKSCIVTASGPTLMGLVDVVVDQNAFNNPGTFVSRFNHGLRPGANLEDLFLKSRETSFFHDFPMISTPEGMEIQNLLYDMMSSYFKYNRGDVQKFGQEYTVKNIATLTCSNQKNYNQILNLLDTIGVMKEIPAELKNFDKLKIALQDYRNYQIKYERSYLDLKKLSDKVLKELKSKYPNESKLFLDKDGVDIITFNYAGTVRFNEDMLKEASSSKQKIDWKYALDLSKIRLKIVNELKQSLTPEDFKIIDANNSVVSKNGETYKLASNVIREARVVYNSLYKTNKTKEGNACRNFTL